MTGRHRTLYTLTAFFLAAAVSNAMAANHAGFGRAIQATATSTTDGTSLEVTSQNKKKKSSKNSGKKCTPAHKAAGHC